MGYKAQTFLIVVRYTDNIRRIKGVKMKTSRIDSVLTLLLIVVFGMFMFVSGAIMAENNHNIERVTQCK